MAHRASIDWTSDGAFASGKYSRAHDWRFDGGAQVRGSSSPTIVPEPMSDAAAVDPEEALVAAASSCHMLWFLSLAQKAGLDVRSYRDEATGEMGRNDLGKMAMVRITLRPVIVFVGEEPSAQLLSRLHRQAHDSCFIAQSLRTEILIEESASR